jgi:hypothetical protein
MKKAIIELYKFIGSFILPLSILMGLCYVILALFIREDALNINALSYITASLFIASFSMKRR